MVVYLPVFWLLRLYLYLPIVAINCLYYIMLSVHSVIHRYLVYIKLFEHYYVVLSRSKYIYFIKHLYTDGTLVSTGRIIFYKPTNAWLLLDFQKTTNSNLYDFISWTTIWLVSRKWNRYLLNITNTLDYIKWGKFLK